VVTGGSGLGNFQKIIYPTDFSMAPSSALRQELHTTSMRPLARLEDKALSLRHSDRLFSSSSLMQLLLLAIVLLCGQGQTHEDEVPVTTYGTSLTGSNSLYLLLSKFTGPLVGQ